MGIYTSQNIQNFGADAANRHRVSNFKTIFNANNEGVFDSINTWDGAIWDDPSNEPGNPDILPQAINANVTGLNGSFIGTSPDGIDPVNNLIPLGLNDTYANSRLILQSKEYFKYSASQSSFARVSGLFTPNQSATATLEIGIISNGNQQELVSQDSWNLDSLSSSVGNNPSRKQIDINNIQSLIIDHDGSVGRIRIGVVIDGQIIYVHQFNSSNAFGTTFLRSLTLPVRADLFNIGGQARARFGTFDNLDGIYLQCTAPFNAGNATGFVKEAAVMVEGDDKLILKPCAVTRLNDFQITTAATFTPILGVRPKTLFNQQRNKTTIFPLSIAICKSQGNPIEFALIKGGQIVTAQPWTDDGDANISYQVNRPLPTDTISGGVCIKNFGTSGGNKEINQPLNPETLRSISLSQIDTRVINQTQLILGARVPAGNATMEVMTINIGENYS